jgi:hypothetical protein
MCMAEVFIMDEMQMLGGQQGPTMEVCLCYVLAVAHVCYDIVI